MSVCIKDVVLFFEVFMLVWSYVNLHVYMKLQANYSTLVLWKIQTFSNG